MQIKDSNKYKGENYSKIAKVGLGREKVIRKFMQSSKKKLLQKNESSVTYLICYLNNFGDAMENLSEARPYLKQKGGNVYQSFKEAQRILRKVKYS